jgi:hypothetical protein
MKILITGATHGMGKGVARVLAGMDHPDHEIILLCRSAESGLATIKELESLSGKPNISMVQCDLIKLNDVKKAIREITRQHRFLDCLFINAGIGYAPRHLETEDGMDAHFLVNYLSQFMLVLNLLALLELSEKGGRVIFNVTEYGEILWDDLQLKNKWSYKKGIFQTMAAKRLLYTQLHYLYSKNGNSKIAFMGFRIHKTVWTNQINIIPPGMRIMANIMKFFGAFISIDECGRVMAPLFMEDREENLKRSGKMITWGKNGFKAMEQTPAETDQTCLNKFWAKSLFLCHDQQTNAIAHKLSVHPILDE